MVPYSSSSQSSIATPHRRIFKQTGGEGESQTTDCLEEGWRKFREIMKTQILQPPYVGVE